MGNQSATTSTVRAMIFRVSGCLIPLENLDPKDIHRFEKVVVPYGIGLIKRESYNHLILELCNELLLRCEFINEKITIENSDAHRRISRFFLN